MLITALCPHHHLEGLRRGGGLLRGSGNFQTVPRGWLPPLPPELVTDKRQNELSSPLPQILFRPQTPVVTFLRAAGTLLRRLTGVKALMLGSQTLQGRGL